MLAFMNISIRFTNRMLSKIKAIVVSSLIDSVIVLTKYLSLVEGGV